MTINRILHNYLNQNDISYGFFTRNGGVSKRPFNSLNCSLNVSDQKINIQENLRLVSKELKLNKIVQLNQTHSSKVHIVINSDDHKKFINADGLVTNLKDIGLSPRARWLGRGRTASLGHGAQDTIAGQSQVGLS